MWMAIAPSPWCPEWQAPLLELAGAVTPAMVWRDQVLLMDVQASLQWLGGVRGLKHRVRQELSTLGICSRVAIALSAPGAWLLAMNAPVPQGQLSWRYALSPKRLAQRLDAIPIDCFSAAKRHVEWLHRVGCYHIGQLRQLDRSELMARTDTALVKAIDQAYGQAVFAYQALKPPPRLEERLELPWLIEHTEALAPYLKRLLQTLCDWLGGHHLAVSRLECRLHHRDRRRAWPPTTVLLSVSNPTSAFAVLWRWLNVRLERTHLPAPVSDISLLTRSLAPAQPHNLSLFANEPQANESASETLDVLRARLGQSGVQQPACLPDYRIERANAWRTQDAPAADHCTLDWGAHCPAWLMTQPKSLKVRNDRPWLQGPLQLLHGPYRIETGWWDQQLALRDYFVATDQSKRRYWIYRERDQLAARWFLQGLFG